MPAEDTRQMEWTCPACRTRNARPVPARTPDGELLEVTCAACGAGFEATAVVRPPSVFGVPWLGSPRGASVLAEP
jgi:hypothetical protein